MTKWIKNAKKKIISQTIISSLKRREKLIITTQNKIEIMFKIHFSFSSTMFMKNIAEFDYFSSIDDETLMTRREIMKVIYKINLNKTLKINKIINRTLRQFVRVIVKQICFFLINASRKKFNHHISKKSLQYCCESREKKTIQNYHCIN